MRKRNPEDFKAIGAEKGSIIIDLVVIVGIATVVSKILLEALKVADRVLDIKKKVEEIKALKLSNAKIEKELQKEVEIEKEQGLNSILESTIAELGLSVEKQGDKIGALKKSGLVTYDIFCIFAEKSSLCSVQDVNQTKLKVV